MLFAVIDSFLIRTRGTVIVAPISQHQALKVEAKVELRISDGRVIQSEIRGVELFSGEFADEHCGVVLDRDVGSIPPGTEVWSVT